MTANIYKFAKALKRAKTTNGKNGPVDLSKNEMVDYV